ncbi:hypothetical protein SAMN02745857_02439 [Andreprevotia lacus DSM 23236]|jgi:hypothetical protein|uniref:Uncharacterized protein n=1 Tax=Andreprevotia lacus DSM 23236 TaxID=1121001 RepID=A0A1W1XQM7_9NEIS|nr:hypothetical protein [Andreprevotia lacus]SMC26279.1 hypothetical protein SAMN02745857_02439 [Andreprevotia lacus DSM 23236]
MRHLLLCLLFATPLAWADGLVLSSANTAPALAPLQTLPAQQSVTVSIGKLLVADLQGNRWLKFGPGCSASLAQSGCAASQPLPANLRAVLTRLPETLAAIAAFDDSLPSRTISPLLTRAAQQGAQLRKTLGDEAALLYLLDAQVRLQDGQGVQQSLNQLALLWPDNKQIGALLAHVRRLGLAVAAPPVGAQVVVKPLELQ